MEPIHKKLFDEDDSIVASHKRYPWVKEVQKAIHQSHWTVDDFEEQFHSDVNDFKFRLDDKERVIIQKAIAAIGNVEAKVKSFWAQLGNNIPQACFKNLGYVLGNNEVIHGDAYQRLLEVLGMEQLFDEYMEHEVIKGRLAYLNKHTHKYYADSKKQFLYSVTLFTLFVENISLFSQFYAVMWFNAKQNVLKGTAQQILYTAVEETTHSIVGVNIINQARKDYPELFDEEMEALVIKGAKLAIKCEFEIIDWMYGDYSKKGQNAKTAKAYISNRMNKCLAEIGVKFEFEVDRELLKDTVWMNEIAEGDVKTDFFHGRPTEYTMRKISEEEIFGIVEDDANDDGTKLF